jgi:ribosomal protein S18 acetylase RimI-like enzyme
MPGHSILEFIPQNNEEDYDKFVPAFLSIWNDPENKKYFSASLRPFSKANESILFKNHLDRGCRYYAAVDMHGEILAISEIKIDHFDCYSIHTLGVRPDAKHQGIGSSMVEHAIELARKLDYKAVDALVFTDNFAILRILLSFEFVPVNMHYHIRADGIDLMTMRKYL